MTKAGRFLWLDWANADVLDTNEDEHGRLTWAVAEHNGYRRFNAQHRRTVSVEGDRWTVRDQIFPAERKQKGQRCRTMPALAAARPALVTGKWLFYA